MLLSSVLLALIPFVAAQTSTSCDPTKKSCPPDPGYSSATTTYNFQQSAPGSDWTVLGSGDKITQDSSGLHFKIDAEGQAPTLASQKYILFGRITAVLEASQGAGIVSAFILQSDDLDEIDWEWLGGDTAHVQSNYFSKGDTTTYDRGGVHNVANPQTTFHTYVIDWSPTQIQWIIDGAVVRTLTAASVGAKYPQTPCQIRIGTWCGGCSGMPQGTVQWSGGPTTFSSSSNYVMTIQSLTVENANPAGSYTYGDMSGLASSIQMGGAIAVSSGSSVGGSSTSARSSTTSHTPAASGTHTSTTLATRPSGSTATAGNNNAAGTSVVTGPTSTTLPTNKSGAAKLTVNGIVFFILGAIVLLA